MIVSPNQFRGSTFDGPAEIQADETRFEVCTTRDVVPYRSFVWDTYAFQDKAIEAAKVLCKRLGQEVWVRKVELFFIGTDRDGNDVFESEENVLKTFEYDEDAKQVMEA